MNVTPIGSRGKHRRGATLRATAGIAALAAIAVTAGCEDTVEPVTLQYTTEDVAANSLPGVDANRLYRYRFGSVKADSILRVLTAARLQVIEAWEPLLEQCTGDPIGPRFTVVLAAPNALISSFGFEPGNGIRACTISARRYIISR